MNKGSRILSRYHVARFMELHYGAGVSIRRIARLTDCTPGAVSRALQRAKAGYEYPEVTARYVSFKKFDNC